MYESKSAVAMATPGWRLHDCMIAGLRARAAAIPLPGHQTDAMNLCDARIRAGSGGGVQGGRAMKDVRITISGRDFPAVSKSMVDLGVGFQVEPVETVEREAESSAPAVPRRRQGKRKATRMRGASAPERAAARESPGAVRLRAMAERNRAAAAGGSGGDVQAGESGGMSGTGSEQTGEAD
jgi:hypothetical protein